MQASRRFQTLLEMLIAMVLTILILTTLTFFYQQITMTGVEINSIEQENFQLRFIENRLSNILTKAVAKNNKLKDFVFFTATEDYGITKLGSTSLIFTFNNGVKLDKIYSNHVIGRLYLDPKDRLILAYWPTPKWWSNHEAPSPKIEILREGVESLSFEFFIPPDKGETEPAPSKAQDKKNQNTNDNEEPVLEPEPKGQWRQGSWLLSYQQLPAMVKVIITLSDAKEKQEFIFPLTNYKKNIVYDQ